MFHVRYELGLYIPAEWVPTAVNLGFLTITTALAFKQLQVIVTRLSRLLPRPITNYNIPTPWPLVRKRTIPTERPPLVRLNLVSTLWIEGCRVVNAVDPLPSLISVF
jgi:hypothetical protein